MIKQLSLLLLIILTIGCDGAIDIAGYLDHPEPPPDDSSGGNPGTWESISIDHISHTFTNYVIGDGDLSLLEGTITNIGDTTITPPYFLGVIFYMDSTFNGICAVPDQIRFINPFPPGESREFTFYGWGICAEYPPYSSFVAGNFGAFQRKYD